MFGSVMWWDRPNEVIDCSVTFPAKPIAASSSVPGMTCFMGSPRDSRNKARFDQDDGDGRGNHGPPIE
jgi:hypothetical protein